jgi:nucleotide-binding universal stress UspA family protein
VRVKEKWLECEISDHRGQLMAKVKRAAVIFAAKVTQVYAFDLYSHDGFQLYVRPPSEVAEEQQDLARGKLDSFLVSEFPVDDCPRILLSGDAATEITQLAQRNGFDLIIMPTHVGIFRRTLLGSTTAKVLNDADCPVLTTRHAETISPRQLETSGMGLRHWLERGFGKGSAVRKSCCRGRPCESHACSCNSGKRA